jgi:hypothetical protein
MSINSNDFTKVRLLLADLQRDDLLNILEISPIKPKIDEYVQKINEHMRTIREYKYKINEHLGTIGVSTDQNMELDQYTDPRDWDDYSDNSILIDRILKMILLIDIKLHKDNPCIHCGHGEDIDIDIKLSNTRLVAITGHSGCQTYGSEYTIVIT